MTIIGIMADIHGKYTALRQALEIMELENAEKILVCGDMVGYGPRPNECCDLLRSLGDRVLAVAGNHDLAACGRHDYFTSFQPGAIQAMNLTLAQLNSVNRHWLAGLPLTGFWQEIAISHASFHRPEDFPYLFRDRKEEELRRNFSAMGTKIGCIGHSHVPFLARLEGGKIRYEREPDGPRTVAGSSMLLDVGSVGCPRTDSGLGSLVIHDSDADTVCFHTFRI